MATKQEFIEAGYNRYGVSDLDSDKEFYECVLRKRFEFDNGECKYFISAYPYKFNPTPGRILIGVNIKLQFYKGKHVFDVTIHHAEDSTVSDIEKMVDDLWVKFGFDPDPHN